MPAPRYPSVSFTSVTPTSIRAGQAVSVSWYWDYGWKTISLDYVDVAGMALYFAKVQAVVPLMEER